MTKEQLIKYYQQYNFFIFPAVVALASFSLIFFAILPQAIKLISNQKDEGDLINQSNLLENKVAVLESYSNANLSQDLGFALNSYPDNKDFATAMGIIQQIVRNSGFTVTSISLGNTNLSSGATQSYQVKVELIGARFGIKNLLNNLENSLRLMRVDNIDISSGGGSEGSSIALVIEVLYSEIPKNSGDVNSPLPQISQKDVALITKLSKVTLSQSQSAPGPRGKADPFE